MSFFAFSHSNHVHCDCHAIPLARSCRPGYLLRDDAQARPRGYITRSLPKAIGRSEMGRLPRMRFFAYDHEGALPLVHQHLACQE